jgi:hypothetical protein
MAAERSMTVPSARAARISGAAFAVGGAILVLGGVASVVTGKPYVAHDLAPITGPSDLLGRFGQVAPILSGAVAAAVAIGVAGLSALRRLAPIAVAIELLVLGTAIEACIGGAAARIGHATDGSVMSATVACMIGGVAVIAGGVIALLGRE